MKSNKEYRRARKIIHKLKNEKKYEMNESSVSSQKEMRDINDMRKQLGMSELALCERECLKCDDVISVFRTSSVWMCSKCRGLKESKDNDNQTY